MQKLIAASAIVFLFFIPVISYAQPEQKAPSVSHVLVREGNFAVKLLEVLKLGTTKNEAEAENMLASAGIAPKNGWIADYPLTPDIIGEVRKAIDVALDSGKIAMTKDEVLMAVQVLIDNQWRMAAAPGEEQVRQYGEYPPAGSTVSPGWSQPLGGPYSRPGMPAPIITHAYAIEKGRYGGILKIYIEADDPNGEMLGIATVVDQVGYGRYPTDWIYVKPQYKHHLLGYLQWNTFSSNAPRLREWTRIAIKVSVFDKARHESNEVVFPFEFVSEAVSNPPPPAPFNNGNVSLLGHIHINLFEPQDMGRGGAKERP